MKEATWKHTAKAQLCIHGESHRPLPRAVLLLLLTRLLAHRGQPAV